MIDAFVDGRLSADDHELMVHHISSCSECAAAVIAALAEAARALAADSADRAATAIDQVPLFDESAEPAPVHDLLQLDLILDRSHDRSADLLLKPERIEELSLEQLAQHPGPVQAPAAHVNGGHVNGGHVNGAAGGEVSVPLAVPRAPAADAAPAEAEQIEAGPAPPAAAESGLVEAVPVEAAGATAVHVEGLQVEGTQTGGGHVAVAQAEGEQAEGEQTEVEQVEVEDVEVERVELGQAGASDFEVEAVALGAALAEAAEAGPSTEAVELETAQAASASAEGASRVGGQDAPLASSEVESTTADSGATFAAVPAGVESGAAAPADDVLLALSNDAPDEAVSAPTTERDYRIPDEERAAILEAVRGLKAEPRARPRRWSLIATAAVALVTFGALVGFGALQLREFASYGDSAVRAPEFPEPAIPAPAAEQDAALPAALPVSVLAPLLDSAIVAVVTEADASIPGAPAADSVTESATVADGAPPPVSGVPQRTPRAPAPTVTTPQRTEGVIQRADPAEPSRTTAAAADSTAGPPALPRLLRTTTHRARADADYVLREYDAAGPAPPPRSGINEYRWRNAAGTRLYVLSGPGSVAELRAYARWLRGL